MLTIKKERKKRSVIWSLPEEEFKDLIRNSRSVRDALAFFGMKCKGNNFKTIKKRISDLDLDISHFLNSVQASNARRALTEDDFKEYWLIESSDKCRYHLKNYLVKFDLLPYICKKCDNIGSWMNEPITLQLEHINGVSDDNRLENLCFLCPNCHSQTPTFSGKKNKKI